MSKKKNKSKDVQQAPEHQNFVHKNMEKFNKPKTFEDRKRAAKNGKVKHKGRDQFTPFSLGAKE